jgi:hypothetical protein
VFEYRSPRVDGDRNFAEGKELPRLKMHLLWVDVLEEVEDGAEARIEPVGNANNEISLVIMAKPEVES